MAEDDQPENAFERFQTQLAIGDLQGCAHTARLMLGAEGVAPLQLLRMARVLALVEKSLAADLWEEAIQRTSLDDDSVLLAVDVAHRLWLEEKYADARFP